MSGTRRVRCRNYSAPLPTRPQVRSGGPGLWDDVVPTRSPTFRALGHTGGDEGVFQRVLRSALCATPHRRQVQIAGILFAARRVDLRVLARAASRNTIISSGARTSNRTASPATSVQATCSIDAKDALGPLTPASLCVMPRRSAGPSTCPVLPVIWATPDRGFSGPIRPPDGPHRQPDARARRALPRLHVRTGPVLANDLLPPAPSHPLRRGARLHGPVVRSEW